MPVRRLHAYPADRTNEVVLAVDLWSDTKRLQNQLSGYVVRVGIAERGDDGGTDWLGEWDQSVRGLVRRTPIRLTGLEPLNFPLTETQVCVTEITEYGAPDQGAEGMTALWRFERLGSVGPVSGRRLDDPGKPRPRAVGAPLFQLGRHVHDQEIRHAIEPLVATLNESGVTRFTIPIPLVSAGDSENVECDSAYDAGPFSPASATFITTASITLTPPETQRKYRAVLHGGASIEDPGAATMGAVRLYDSTGAVVVGPTQMRCGVSGASAGVEIASVTVGEECYLMDRGVGARAFELQVNLQAGGPATWIDTWITGRLVPDPQSVP